MASEIRVDKINSLSGVGTVTLSPTGVDIAGITTAATLRATTGIVTSLTAGSLTSLGAVSGTTGTFTGDLTIPDKIVHTGDTDTAIRLGVDTVTVETAGSERLRITSAGKFGINTTSPVGKLTVDDNNASEHFQLRNTTNTSNFAALGVDSSFNLRIYTNGSNERMRIDSSGRVLIGGTSNPSGASTRTLNLIATSASEAALVFSRSNSLGGSTTGQDIKLQTNGDLTFDVHNVGEKVRFPAAGGITFNGDTAAANALDDYEEGTWTPTIQFGGNSVSVTYQSQAGSYTKVGNRVYFQSYLHLSNKGSSTGVVGVGGLPHTSSSAGASYSVIPVWINTWTGGDTVPTGYVEPGATTIRLQRQNASSSGGVFNMDNSNINNTTDIMVAGHYAV
tara:strand:+ start:1632 stop:2807 length:1176 start_codon:yes stop_codon:yes gene_type:complete